MDDKTRRQIIAQLIEEHRQEQAGITGRSHSLFVRHLDCGSCNACERELNALTNPLYDIGRWGIRFEPSPRHADVLAMTGPYVRGLEEAARETLAAMPVPRIILIGDCAMKKSVFEAAYGTVPLPVDIDPVIIVPGCPPTPLAILKALIQAKDLP